MAEETILDNAKVQEVGLPRVPDIYEQALRLLAGFEKAHRIAEIDYNNMMRSNSKINNDYRKGKITWDQLSDIVSEKSSRTTSLANLASWFYNMVRDKFEKDDVFKDLYDMLGITSSKNINKLDNVDASVVDMKNYVNEPSYLETAKALSDIDDKFRLANMELNAFRRGLGNASKYEGPFNENIEAAARGYNAIGDELTSEAREALFPLWLQLNPIFPTASGYDFNTFIKFYAPILNDPRPWWNKTWIDK